MYSSKFFYILKECSDRFRWKGAASGIVKIECREKKSKVYLTIQNLNPSVLKYTLYLLEYNDTVFEIKGVGQFLSGTGKQYFEYEINTSDCGRYNVALITAETIQEGKRTMEFCLAGGTSNSFQWKDDIGKMFRERNKSEIITNQATNQTQAKTQAKTQTNAQVKTQTNAQVNAQAKTQAKPQSQPNISEGKTTPKTINRENEDNVKINKKENEAKKDDKDSVIETFTNELNTYFDRIEPFEVSRNDYTWWKVTNLSNLNNILYKCKIGLPITMNPKVMISHFKNKHMLVGIYSDRNHNSRYIVFGTADTENGNGSGMPFDNICRWAATKEDKGYWLVYADTGTGELLC